MDLLDLNRGITEILTNDSVLKSISTGGINKVEDISEDVFGKGYETYKISLGAEAYDKPIKIAIGIPRKSIDPEMEKRPTPDTKIYDFERELEKFQRMLPNLMKTYPDEFVAIINGVVIDHDKDELKLAKRVYSKYKNEFVLVREVREQLPEIFALESPEGIVR